MSDKEIAIRVPSFNRLRNLYKKNPPKAEAVERQMKMAAYNAYKDESPLQHLCHVTFTWYEMEMDRDVDNVAACCKFLLDGMRKAGVFPDDSPVYIDGITHRFVYGGTKYKVRIHFDQIVKVHTDIRQLF